MKVGVLGAGEMGSTVIEHLQMCDGVSQIIAYDINPERAQSVSQRYKIGGAKQLSELLDDPAVRLVFITAANVAHKELAIAALEAGKAVMCEKPMATTLEGAREMTETAERLGAFLQIGFELRYSRLYTTVKDWIDAGLLGQVVNTHCYYICNEFHGKGSWRNKMATGGSMFGEKLSHYADLSRWWVGSAVQEVHSLCAPNVIPYYEVRDNYHATYRFENGAASHLTFMMAPGASYTGDPLQDHLEVQVDDGHHLRFLLVGTGGAAETDVFRRTLKRWSFGDSPSNFTSTWVENITWDKADDQLHFHDTKTQTHDIVRRVLEGLPPKTSARDAYDTMRLCEAVDVSADQNRIVNMNELG